MQYSYSVDTVLKNNTKKANVTPWLYCVQSGFWLVGRFKPCLRRLKFHSYSFRHSIWLKQSKQSTCLEDFKRQTVNRLFKYFNTKQIDRFQEQWWPCQEHNNFKWWWYIMYVPFDLYTVGVRIYHTSTRLRITGNSISKLRFTHNLQYVLCCAAPYFAAFAISNVCTTCTIHNMYCKS